MEYRFETMNMSDYSIENELIEDINQNIFDELDCAKRYAMAALRHKSDNKSMADTEITASAQELEHANMLMNKIHKMLESLKDQKAACYDWLALSWYYTKHRVIGYMDWVKSLHEKYKK